MDALAYDMATTWLLGPTRGGHPWLPYKGASAVEHLQTYHRARYLSPRLKAGDAKLRRAAREAFRRLAIAFAENGMARDESEAKSLAANFSMAANAHADADCSRLKQLCSHLQTLLLSEGLGHRSGMVGLACLDFIKFNDFNVLEIALDEAVRL